MGHKEAVKVWASTPEKAKEALDALQRKGYDAEGFERFTVDSVGWSEVGFFGNVNGSTGFTESKDYFTERPYALLRDTKPELERPPVGLAPAYIWKSLRVKDILAAMVRYHGAGKTIPDSWISELSELQQNGGV